MVAAIYFYIVPDVVSFVKLLQDNLGIPIERGKKIVEMKFLYFGSFISCKDPDLKIDEKSKEEIKDFLKILDKNNIHFSIYWEKNKMKYKLIKTIVNVKTHAIVQTIDICNNEEELINYWENIPRNNMIYRGVSNEIGDIEYYIQSGKIKDSDYIVTIMQYTMNFLP